ncbi:MAG: apolipoprotein N-acyltransferase [Proteobacteria bacterium]|nr:apolipoprotein N-acyltransferase [Pseudomonadota bacterium]
MFEPADITRDVLSLLSGILFPLALAPFDFWPLALLVPGVLLACTRTGSVRRTVGRFYLFNLGLYGAGASWIYVSVHEYGGAPALLAGSLVALLVLAFSLTSLPQALLFARYCRSSAITLVAGFSGLWVLGECFKAWIFTGFPWLFLGYGLTETGFANLAPVTGIYGLSLVAVLMSCALVTGVLDRAPAWWLLPVALLPLLLLEPDRWTRERDSITVSLVQGNVDQHVKWHKSSRQPIVDLYVSESSTEWGRDLVVWPEAAITYFREQAPLLLEQLGQRARSAGSTLVLGIPDRDAAGGFQNTVLAIGTGHGQYIKRRLVPFGEYVPLEDYLRGIVQVLDLPMSRNRPGPPVQVPLKAGDLVVSTSICYEVIYPELVRSAAADPDLLLTVSNDTWFGASIGPWQHLQMARMRALENGRGMARATSNGITALIDHRGQITAVLPQFERGVLRGELSVRTGQTPFHRLGSLPVLLMALLLVLLPIAAPALWRYFRPMR